MSAAQPHDVLDAVEAAAVKALMKLHGETEATIRRWIDKGGNTARLYRKICQHNLRSLVAAGFRLPPGP